MNRRLSLLSATIAKYIYCLFIALVGFVTALHAQVPVILNSGGLYTYVQGSNFSFNIIASNAPTSYTITGVPSGTGLIVGGGGIFASPFGSTITNCSNIVSATLIASNANGNSAPGHITILIQPPASFTPNNIIYLTTGVPTSNQLFFWFAAGITSQESSGINGGLPPGTSLNPHYNFNTGDSEFVNGTPTTSGLYVASYGFSNTSCSDVFVQRTLIVSPAGAPIVGVVSVTDTVNIPFSYAISSTNGPSTYSLHGSLPTGLSFNSTTGVINGTAQVSGFYPDTVLVTNAAGTGYGLINIHSQDWIPVITSAKQTDTVGEAFNYSIIASSSTTISYAASGLPPGLGINTGTGLISGTPTTAGTFIATITATNTVGPAVGYDTIVIANKTLCAPFDNTSFPANITGTSCQWQLDTGSGFANISDNSFYTGTATSTLQLIDIPESYTGYQYRCVVDGNNGTPNTIQFQNSWTGAVDANWENPGNWSCGVVPDNNTDVVITSGTVVLNSNVTVRSLNLSPTVNFTVNNGFNLTVAH